jgi:hypothetical protein
MLHLKIYRHPALGANLLLRRLSLISFFLTEMLLFSFLDDGTIWSLGNNTGGQLGIGNSDVNFFASLPLQVNTPANKFARSISVSTGQRSAVVYCTLTNPLFCIFILSFFFFFFFWRHLLISVPCSFSAQLMEA